MLWWKILIGVFVFGNLTIWAMCRVAGKADESMERAMAMRTAAIVKPDIQIYTQPCEPEVATKGQLFNNDLGG